MTSHLRRRLHHGDVDGRFNGDKLMTKDDVASGGDGDGLNEPLLGSYNRYSQEKKVGDDGDLDSDSDDERRKKERLHWTFLFSNLIAQWAHWLANVVIGSGSLMGRLLPFSLATSQNGKFIRFHQHSLNPLQEERLQILRRRLKIPFDGSCQEHQDALKQLWMLAFPVREVPPLKSELWKEMGWQGSDPATDFRGAGYISLENLIFFGQFFPETFQRLLLKQDGKRAEWEYPFAVAGINISFMLAQMLDLQSGKVYEKPHTIAGIQFLELLKEDEMTFDILYCVAFQMMDAQWLAKRASYMEFNEVLKSTRTQLERELALEDVSSIRDLPAYNMLRR